MTNWIHLYFQEVLDNARIDLLPKLKFFKEKWFYLAWWTALALQYWHRKSMDFDFFIDKNIDTNKLYDEILLNFANENIKKTYEEKNTLYIEINWIKLSFFTYKYKLINPLIETDFLNIASKIDISAMKLWAIQKRATNKDYVDIYYLIKDFSINTIINSFFEKFWKVISDNLILKSLVYFDDIIEEPLILNNKISFEEIKAFLIKTVWNIK